MKASVGWVGSKDFGLDFKNRPMPKSASKAKRNGTVVVRVAVNLENVEKLGNS